MEFSCTLLLLSLGYMQCNGQSSYYFENHKYCDDLSPYFGEIDLDQISGVWYGVEKIPHTKGEYKIEHTKECFHIDIREVHTEPTPPTSYLPLTNSPYVSRSYGLPEQYRIRHFVLEWNEGLWRDEYHIKVNTSHKGFWPTDVPNGFASVTMYPVALLAIFTAATPQARGLCGESIRWSHSFDVDDIFGLWYGVGYAQHTPDMTNKPDEIGCVSLYITDATYEVRNDWLNWAVPKNNNNDQIWRSYKSNPWSEYAMSGSWLDIPLKRPAKRSTNEERRIRVLWDEDGQTMEQIYLYSPEDPGIWIAEKLRPLEREMRSRGIDIWYPDDPPRHPEVIRVLKASPHMLLMNHCSETGDGGIFTLILKRSITRLQRWDWYKYKQEIYNYDLPKLYRYSTVCAGCMPYSSTLFLIFCNIALQLLKKVLLVN